MAEVAITRSCVREHLTGALHPDGKEIAQTGPPGVTFGDPIEGDGQESRQTFRIADPQPDDACQRPHSWCARRQRLASGRTVAR
jgi:hypothetical protein